MLAAAKRGTTCRRYRDRTASACSMLCTPAKLATRNHFRIRKRQIVACSARFSMPLEHIFMHSKSLCMPLGAVKVCIGIVRGPVRAYCIVWGALRQDRSNMRIRVEALPFDALRLAGPQHSGQPAAAVPKHGIIRCHVTCRCWEKENTQVSKTNCRTA